MNIIFGHDVADKLREKYYVLELESFDLKDSESGKITSFCVLSPESVVLGDMPDMDRLLRLHQTLIDSFNIRDDQQVKDIIPHLRGKFSGEMDSFYSIIEEKMKNEQ